MSTHQMKLKNKTFYRRSIKMSPYLGNSTYLIALRQMFLSSYLLIGWMTTVFSNGTLFQTYKNENCVFGMRLKLVNIQ